MNHSLRSRDSLALQLLLAASCSALLAAPQSALAEPPANANRPANDAKTKTKTQGDARADDSALAKPVLAKPSLASDRAAGNASNSGPTAGPGHTAGPENADDLEHADPAQPDKGLLDPAAPALANPGATPGSNAPTTSPPSEPAQTSGDAPVTVITKINPDPSFVGDRLVLEVIAAYPKGYRVNLPTGVDFAPLHLVEIDEGEPEQSAEGYFRKVFTITLQHFDVGEAKVPGFPLTYVGTDGEVETVRVAPRSFTVDSLLANEADPERKLEDPPISLEYPNTTAELVIYSATIAMLVGFFLALFWRRFASRRKVIIGPPPVPAHVLALSALSELESSEFLETGMVQDYYLELTEIAKGYLEGRFGVDALDRTTDEIRRDLVRHRERIQPLDPEAVLRFLEDCDLVKFARFDPELDEARTALGEVRTMVEDTKPIAASEPPEATPIGTTGDDTSSSQSADSGAVEPKTDANERDDVDAEEPSQTKQHPDATEPSDTTNNSPAEEPSQAKHHSDSDAEENKA